MKYSKTALMELSHRYSSILKRCAFLNAAIFLAGAIALPAMADTNFTGALNSNLIGLSDVGGDYLSPTTLYFVPKGYSASIGDGFTISKNVADSGILGTSGSGARSSLTIEKSTFSNNEAKFDGGAIASFGDLTIKGTTFTQNIAQTLNAKDEIPIGGGAIALGAVSNTNIQGGIFSENESKYSAGAIGTRDFYNGANVNAFLDITGSTFTGNIAAKQGGAIDNYFYASNKNSNAVYVGNSSFINNTAENGGAIYNHGSDSLQKGNPQVASIEIDGGTFTNNIATLAGGAIFNEKDATVILSGTNIFSGNTANGKANDIYNAGTLNVSGNLTLDGGITGNGIINFTDATSLTAQLKSTASIFGTAKGLDKVTVSGLVVENGLVNGTYKLFANGDSKFKDITATNSLYDFESDGNGQIKITKKSTEKIVENLTSAGATAQEALTISAISSSTSDSPVLTAISTAVQGGNVAMAAEAAKDLAPTTSQQVMGVAQGVNNVLSNVTGNRMSAMGRAGGDAFIGGALWAQGLYNHTKQDENASSDGFTANTRGLALGIDGKVNQAVTLGLGYGYTNTNADAGGKDIDVDGHNFFAYAQYQPNAWYVNGMIGYSLSKYTEEKSPMGITMKSKYDVNTYSANLTSGYDFANGITPHIGLRYILAKQDGYNDGAQYIKSDDNNLLTGVLGVKYTADVKAKDLTFAPNIRLAATYDFISDNSVANVNVIGGGSYQITGERLKRFGVETGVGFETTYGDWNLMIDYNGSFKKDYQSHTGMLKAKYNF